MVFNILENVCRIIANILCVAICYTSNDNTPLLKSDCITSRIGIYEKVSLTRLFTTLSSANWANHTSKCDLLRFL